MKANISSLRKNQNRDGLDETEMVKNRLKHVVHSSHRRYLFMPHSKIFLIIISQEGFLQKKASMQILLDNCIFYLLKSDKRAFLCVVFYDLITNVNQIFVEIMQNQIKENIAVVTKCY